MIAEIGIRKIRYHYKCHSGLVWEIDYFPANDARAELIIAEVELVDEEQELTIPKIVEDVMIKEITGISKYSNFNMSTKKELKSYIKNRFL